MNFKKFISGVLVFAMVLTQFTGMTAFAASPALDDEPAVISEVLTTDDADTLGDNTKELADFDSDADKTVSLESDADKDASDAALLDEAGDDAVLTDASEDAAEEDGQLDADMPNEDEGDEAPAEPPAETPDEAPVEGVEDVDPPASEVIDEADDGEAGDEQLATTEANFMAAMSMLRAPQASEMSADMDEAEEAAEDIAPQADDTSLVTTGVSVTNYDRLGGVRVQFGTGGGDRIVLEANGSGRTYGDAFTPNGITMTIYGLSAEEQAAFKLSEVFNNAATPEEGDMIPMALIVDDGDGATQNERTPAGTYSVRVDCGASAVSINGRAFTVSSTGSGTINVAKRPITIAAKDAYKIYGQSDPAFEWVLVNGTIVNNDVLYVEGASSGLGLDRQHNGDKTEQVGSYLIESHLTNRNYDITFNKTGKLTIGRAELVITGGFKDALGSFQQTVTREYGNKDLEAWYSVSGLQNGDLMSDLEAEAGNTVQVEFTATSQSVPGDYYVVPSGLGGQLSNYDVVYNNGTVHVTKRAITITVDDFAKEYGDADPDEFTHEILAPNAALPNRPAQAWDGKALAKLNGGVTREAGENAGEYGYINGYTAEKNPYYDITFNFNPFVIRQAPLVITANDASRPYGEDNPEFSATFMGLKRGETAENNSLTGALQFSCAADKTSDVGEYAITPFGFGEDGNYKITYANGTLHVTPRAISVSIDSHETMYGEELEELTYTLSCELGEALVNGDVLEGGIESDPAPIKNAGEYRLFSTLSHKNYDISVEEGKYVVTKRPVSVKIDDKTSVYGEALEELTYSFECEFGDAIMEGDVIEGGIVSDPAPIKNVGEYALKSELHSDNYEFTANEGKYIVTPRPVTITIDDHESVYGEELEELTYTMSCELGEALMEGDTFEGEIFSAPMPIKNVGEYRLFSSLHNDNYELTVKAGKYVITPATITVRIKDATKFYGTETELPEVVFEGWKYDDEQAFLASQNEAFGRAMMYALRSNDASILPNIDIQIAEEVAGIKGYAADNTDRVTYEDAFVYSGGEFGNYKFEMATGNLDVVRLAATDSMFGVNGAVKGENVFGSNVVIKAADGYKLSLSDALEGNEWLTELNVTGDGAHNVKFYMLRVEDGAITTSEAMSFTIDTYVPPVVVSNPVTGMSFLADNLGAIVMVVVMMALLAVLLFMKSKKTKAVAESRKADVIVDAEAIELDDADANDSEKSQK